jgi:hypothetical protein
MITPDIVDQIAEAYNIMIEKDTANYVAEEVRIAAVTARETKFMGAINEAQADGITDPGRQQQKAQKATREELTALHLAERASRKTQHELRQAGMKVDCLNKMVTAAEAARQK